MRLYEIDGKHRELLSHAQSFDEKTPSEVVDEWFAKFEEMQGSRSKKLEAIFHIMNEEKGEADFIDIEIQRLNVRKEKKLKSVERLKNMIELSMKNANESEIKTELFTAKFVKNPAKLLILNDLLLSGIDKELEIANIHAKEVKSRLTEKKKEIKEALKKGEKIQGAELSQSKRLQLK